MLNHYTVLLTGVSCVPSFRLRRKEVHKMHSESLWYLSFVFIALPGLGSSVSYIKER